MQRQQEKNIASYRPVKCICSCKAIHTVFMTLNKDEMHVESCSQCHKAYRKNSEVIITKKSQKFSERYEGLTLDGI